ncbi:DNA primase subunit PRI2 [Spizellomyces punctatus DAOM BR117]|uniref:DNA primase large subunit n=1 Tax=Spizellomyces punctatus (strain DAOM BR117) TaxID=645134 RepID=A0A0L0HIU4_SPIPD|nr:DNA primase subunit PRI2 [Spizellomyces punctatus DAOM BR117]KND01027.1 hypothetical protein SPPG_04120 [Spizellomyces punctatus DAOM BR117]|eukprot:XP_016609066.1 hypothetical protein SPPG_04120 [Spizellomyces punctatus DAOM BR117]
MLKQRGTSIAGGSYEVVRHADPKLGPYPSSLNFYIDPPPYELTLNEFETFALDRLRVLKAVETAYIRSKKEEDAAKYIQNVHDEHLHLGRNVTINRVGAQKLYEERRKDHISHFILRLAYCRTTDLRQWFIKQETALFMYRYKQEEQVERDRFLKHVQMDMSVITPEEKKNLETELRATHGLSTDELSQINFYRVQFEQVLDLVGRRQVYLHAGWAYVPEREQPTLVANAFRTHLNAALEATAKAVPQMDEDDRLVPVLNSISKQYLSKAYTPGSGGPREHVTSDDIDGLVPHFPPCMRNLHEALRHDGHLKHMGRLTYGLFLKGVGLPLEEALLFWRKSFHKMTDDQFQKGYAYNVRYNYGAEGKRTNYTPYSCMKIITSNQPGPGDHHGCPFKHFSSDNLRTLMHRYGVAESGITDIARLAREGHYQVACTKLFEVTRGQAHRQARAAAGEEGGGIIETIEHPNQWFDMSYKGAHRRQRKSTRGGPSEGSHSGEEGVTGATPMEVDR